MTSPRLLLLLLLLVPLLLSFSGTPAFAVDPPVLGCEVANGQATLARAVTGYSYALESSSNLVDWSNVTTEGTQAAGKLSVSLPLVSTGCFFRLRPSNVPARVTVIINETDEDLAQTAPGSYGRPTTDPSPWGECANSLSPLASATPSTPATPRCPAPITPN